MQLIQVEGKTMILDPPNESAWSLHAWHSYCKRHNMLTTAARIEVEVAKRPFSEQVLMQRLGYTVVEQKLIKEKM